jgi:uncharacterized OsmC-like protein
MTDPATPIGDDGHRYEARAATTGTGVAMIHTRQTVVPFDSSPQQGDDLPGPADLLTSAFAACVVKNVERMGELLPFQFERAAVDVHAEREDTPARITRISYDLTVVTDEPDARVDLLHRNIQRHSTIFNTLAASCDVTGTITAVRGSSGIG